jgi:DNA-binding MarR family transcriptional regulator
MEPHDEGFLIGSLLALPFQALTYRVYASYVAAGFDDLRPVHMVVFQHLPPAGCRVTELAGRARMTKQAMGYLVDALEERGYLQRVPDPTDGRAQLVRRTERGWEVNRTARRVVSQVQTEWAHQLGEERMSQLLERLRDLFDLVGGVNALGTPSEIATWIRHTVPR